MLCRAPLPSGNNLLRNEIYAGAIFKSAPTAASAKAVEEIRALLKREIGEPVEKMHDNPSVGDRLREIRLVIAQGANFQRLQEELIAGLGFRLEETAYDVIRLRAALHLGFRDPAAVRSYATHRDTWFANPQCQINWWIALHDVTQEQTFSFFPRYFNKGIANTSGSFDYAEWMRKVGWQSTRGTAPVDYPQVIAEPEAAAAQGFSCKAGEILLFSASHLHRTNPNATGITRLSIDFRTVHIPDFRTGRGAPNVDNGSRPDVLKDYILPAGANVA